MTKEELLEARKKMIREHEIAIENLRSIQSMELRDLLDGWAEQHATFKVGDTIKKYSRIIKVERIFGAIDERRIDGCLDVVIGYIGPRLTSTLQTVESILYPGDVARENVFEADGEEEKIVKIK